MPIAHEVPTKKSLRASARRLFEWLGYRYVDGVLALEGSSFTGMLDQLVGHNFETYTQDLRDAPAALTAPKVLGTLLEEALADALLAITDKLATRVGAARASEIVRDFAKALDRQRFLAPDDRSFRLWVADAVAMPGVEPSQGTREDEDLAEYVRKLTPAERESVLEIDRSAPTLRDLSPLAALPALRKLMIRSGLLEDLSPIARLTGLEELAIEAPRLRDLSPIAPLAALRKLDLNVGASDLSPLASLDRLEELDLRGCDAIADVAPISQLPALRVLELEGTAVRDVAPLVRLPALRDLRPPAGFDLGPLPSFTALTALVLRDQPVPSLDFLGGLTQLRKLEVFSFEELTDVGALAKLAALEELDLTHAAKLADLSPLRGLRALRVLNLFGTGRSLPPVGELPSLEELEISCSEIHTLEGIEQAHHLRKLAAAYNNIWDLRPLASLAELEHLELNSNDHKLEDLGPLRGLPRLRDLCVSSQGIRTLSPLAEVKTLEQVRVTHSAIESVAPLGGLPRLREVTVTGCWLLESLQPLAACPKLESLECHDCDRLRGPKTLDELRRPPAPPPKRFPSAVAEPVRAGTPVVFDARNHLPRRPPEGWSMPERSLEEPQSYLLEAEGVTVAIWLRSPDDHDPVEATDGTPRGGRHLLMVHLAPRDRQPASDKKVARILRRFRACDAFVETRWEEVSLPDVPWMRTFLAFAHPASAASWAAVREEQNTIRVEAADAPAAAASSTLDLKNHLPEPWPEGWQMGRGGAGAFSCNIETPVASLTALLRSEPGSDTPKLLVGVFPLRGQPPWVGDDVARMLLAQFRARGPFEESSVAPFANAPGFRLFTAKAC
jgi:Leucine-rich repeat (LRR) protein